MTDDPEVWPPPGYEPTAVNWDDIQVRAGFEQGHTCLKFFHADDTPCSPEEVKAAWAELKKAMKEEDSQ